MNEVGGRRLTNFNRLKAIAFHAETRKEAAVDSQATNDTNKEIVEPPTPRMGQDGKPIYDQEFFLAMARCGKDAWNQWREANPKIKVTFEGVNFEEPRNEDINFSKFQLGVGANFRDCRFGDRGNLIGATFGGRANFSRAAFGDDLCLVDATFGDNSSFRGATFGNAAHFNGATFAFGADFSDATFGDRADFSRAIFNGLPGFLRATFGDDADFTDAAFGDNATFTKATFKYRANFSGVTFGVVASFSGATFGAYADLSGATLGEGADLRAASFRDGASFSGATFGDAANLSGATFEVGASFSGATFGIGTSFSGATFGDGASFSGATFGDGASFSGATFGDEASFSGATFWGIADLTAKSIEELRELMKSWPETPTLTDAKPDAFAAVSFASAHFEGIVDFSGRNFSRRCDLTGAQFSQPPQFDDCKGTSNINLYGSTIRFSGTIKLLWLRCISPGWTTNSDVALRLRALRKLADETKNHDLERDLYIEERRAERGIVVAEYWHQGWTLVVKPKFFTHCLWIAVMGGYWLLSDYGRSVVRPIVALVSSVFVFYWAYVAVLQSVVVLESPNAAATRDFKDAVWAHAIANAVPFVGALTLEKEVKTTLLCGGRADYRATVPPGGVPSCVPISPRRFQLITIGQSIFSAICIFFAGLALRNYFKLR
jgi:hypothetical protein